jgi:hypothetical protein
VDSWLVCNAESTASAPGGHYDHCKIAEVIAELPDDHKDYLAILAETYADAKSC